MCGTGLAGLGGRKMSGRESASAHGNLEFRKWSTSACWPCTLAYVTSHTCIGSHRKSAGGSVGGCRTPSFANQTEA